MAHTKIEDGAMERLRNYCDKRGCGYKYIVSKAVKEYIDRHEADEDGE